MSGGDEKQLKQFIEAGADNVIQKPAKTDTLVNILLTGLEMVVVFNETQQYKPSPTILTKKPTTVSSMNKEKDEEGNLGGKESERGACDIELIRQEHMKHLLTFLTETKAKAKARTVTPGAIPPSKVLVIPSL